MKWVEHVRAYATSKGISYREALKDSECKETYHKQKLEKSPTVEQGNNATGQRQLLKVLFFGGGQNIKNQGVFAAARLDVALARFSFICFLYSETLSRNSFLSYAFSMFNDIFVWIVYRSPKSINFVFHYLQN
jgi:hypothetical protein